MQRKPDSTWCFPLAIALLVLAMPASASAAACDSAAEAWSTAGSAIDALAAGNDAAARTLVEPLLRHDCSPTGADPAAIELRRAVLEARLVRLEVSAHAVRARFLQADLSRATFAGPEQFQAWTVRVLFPLARRIERAMARDVMPEAAALLRDARDEPAIRADAAAIVAALSTRIATVLGAAPRPAGLDTDPAFAAAYRDAIAQVVHPWLDAARDAVNLANSLARTTPLEPRLARRAAAVLALRHDTP